MFAQGQARLSTFTVRMNIHNIQRRQYVRSANTQARRNYSTVRTTETRRSVVETVTNVVRLQTTTLHNAVAVPMIDLQRTLGVPDVLSGPNCPLLTPQPLDFVLGQIGSLLPGITPGQSYSAFSSAMRVLRPKSGHLYVHVSCIGLVRNIAARLGVHEEEVRIMLSHPAVFPVLWAGCMPYGGVTIDVCPSPQIRSEVFPSSRLVLTRGRDPILFSDHTSIPRNSIRGVDASATYFLAQTLYGHALTGSVLHYMCVTPNGEIVVMWIGAGVGVPIIGGHLNNIVALHDGHGIWPAMGRNMREALDDREIIRSIVAAIHGTEQGPSDVRDVVAHLNAMMDRRHGHRASLYALGSFNNWILGAPVRFGSGLWGGSGMNPKGTPPPDGE